MLHGIVCSRGGGGADVGFDPSQLKRTRCLTVRRAGPPCRAVAVERVPFAGCAAGGSAQVAAGFVAADKKRTG
jgi:hypothetical protein